MCVVNVFRKLGKGFLYPFSLFSYPETSTLRCLRRSKQESTPYGQNYEFLRESKSFFEKNSIYSPFPDKTRKMAHSTQRKSSF